MKSQSNEYPSKVQDLGDGRSHFNYNIVKKEEEDELKGIDVFYTYDQVTIRKPLTYGKIVEALVLTRYSIADELSIQRQKETKPQEFDAYFAFVELCKKIANE